MSTTNSLQPAVEKRLIQQKKLRQKLGDVSPMWLFRHREELPEPMLIAGRRFWCEDEVDAFIQKLSHARKANEPRCSRRTP